MRSIFQFHARRPLAALVSSPIAHYSRRYVSQKLSDPLRILFCGSDDFSIASLRALYDEHTKNRDFIASIDVVCRPPKRVGRGLKQFRSGRKILLDTNQPAIRLTYTLAVSIAGAARKLGLPLHEIDAFTRRDSVSGIISEWTPPTRDNKEINLVVTASFGLLVPHRILYEAKYGGLNVHPSMLPDFRGAAPIHHTLLRGEKNTGVTLQTMHPTQFDKGMILAQTEYPGFEHSCSTVPELVAVVAPKGAEMLVQGLRDRVYVPPLKDLSLRLSKISGRLSRYAPKITRDDLHINWDTWTAERILLTQRLMIGSLWNEGEVVCSGGGIELKRIIWSQGFQLFSGPMNNLAEYGRPIVVKERRSKALPYLVVGTCDGHTLITQGIKIAGKCETPVSHILSKNCNMAAPIDALEDVAKALVPKGDSNTATEREKEFAIFHQPLR